MNRIVWLLRRAKTVLQTEGLIPLVWRVLAFMARRVARHSVRHRTYYLYELATEDVCKLNESDFSPKIDDFTLKVISTNEEADELEKEGLEFRSQVKSARQYLDKEAIAVCLFVGQELVHRRWIAMSEEVKNSIGEPPHRVDFSKNEFCNGGTWTNPKYRGTGLSTYADFYMFQFMKERGKTLHRATIARGNIAAQRGYAKLSPKMVAEARYLRILWWKWWKEKPLP